MRKLISLHEKTLDENPGHFLLIYSTAFWMEKETNWTHRYGLSFNLPNISYWKIDGQSRFDSWYFVLQSQYFVACVCAHHYRGERKSKFTSHRCQFKTENNANNTCAVEYFLRDGSLAFMKLSSSSSLHDGLPCLTCHDICWVVPTAELMQSSTICWQQIQNQKS